MTISYSVTITNDRDPGRRICAVSPSRPTVDGGLLVTEENGRGGAWVWALRPGDTVAIQRVSQPLVVAAASENPPPPVPVGGHRDDGGPQNRTGAQVHPTPPREITRYHAHPTHQIDEGGVGGGAERLLRTLEGGMTDVLADVQARGVAAHASPLQIDRWRRVIRDALAALGGGRPDPNP